MQTLKNVVRKQSFSGNQENQRKTRQRDAQVINCVDEFLRAITDETHLLVSLLPHVKQRIETTGFDCNQLDLTVEQLVLCPLNSYFTALASI